MADLLQIYKALANTRIVLSNGTEVKAWYLDEVKNKVVSDQTPIRLLLPPGAEGGSAVGEVVTVSRGTSNITWRIPEIMLYRPVGQTRGPVSVWQELTDYIQKYIQAFSGLNAMLSTGGVVVGFEPRVAVLEWPEGSGNEFFGVSTVTLVQAVLC